MLRTTRYASVLGLALALPVAAHEAAAGRCDYVIDFDVTLTPGQVVLGDGAIRYALSGDRVARNGRELALQPEQHAAAEQYRAGMETLVPAINTIARRAALLGIESVVLVGAGLSGDDGAMARAVERIEGLAMRLHLQLDGRHLNAGKVFGDIGLDEEIDAIAGDAASGLMGGVAALVGRALFDPATASARGEYVERLVEHRIEPRAHALGTQADRVCAQLRTLDALESRIGAIDAIRAEQAI